MQTYNFYEDLVKSFFAPPAYVFGPVWTVLYVLIAISFGAVFVLAFKKKLSWKIALPFILNLVFNLLYTPLMFGLKNISLASLDILLVLCTLVWSMFVIYKHKKWIAYIQIPYLLWVLFATILQMSVWFLNK